MVVRLQLPVGGHDAELVWSEELLFVAGEEVFLLCAEGSVFGLTVRTLTSICPPSLAKKNLVRARARTCVVLHMFRQSHRSNVFGTFRSRTKDFASETTRVKSNRVVNSLSTCREVGRWS